METGFLNPIHDEEHFSSTFYNQENGLDGTENMLFGEMIVPDVIDYDNLWHSVDDLVFPGQSGETSSSKEDLHRILFEYQNQLTYLQEPIIEQILPVAEKTTQEVSEILSSRNRTSSPIIATTLDDLFLLDEDKNIKENNHSENNECIVKVENSLKNIRETTHETSNETVAAEIKLKQEPLVVKLKKEIEEAGGDVDVETVDEEVPLLMARDLTSLLEQFEATERVNSIQPPMVVIDAASPPRPSTQTIRDALPPEVIKRIKATRENHKKMISVIPAMPSKRTGRAATRMQDAGVALSRNKLLKLITGGSSGESVQLDHDYCTNGSDSASISSRSCYVSDSSEYPSQASTPDTSYSRVPEYLVSLLPQKLKERTRATDTGSRKDSGLESGENSDDDMGHPINQVKSKILLNSVPKLKSVNVMTENGVVISSPVIRNNVPMVSLLKKNNIKVENNNKAVSSSCAIRVVDCVPAPTQNSVNTLDVSKKKKKLNLEEYRVRREERDRIRSQESSRANSPVGVLWGTSTAQPDSTTTSQEGVPKEKPLMLSVEVQTQTCDFIDLTSSSVEGEKSRKDRKDKRNDLKHKSYRSRYVSSSSSSSSVGADRYHSHRRKRRSRSDKRRRSSVSRLWSRSPSRSSSTHSASSRSRSRSHDRRQKWRSRSPRRNNSSYRNNRNFHRREEHDQPRHRPRSPVKPVPSQDFCNQEKVRQIEERRVIYVGRIDEGTTKADLRMRFQKFGPIVDISVHFRERGDNYGFVTFAFKSDAYMAVEHGNDDPKHPRYDLCFGGRRAFCKQRYADLDGMATDINDQYGPAPPPRPCGESFDLLLHEVKSQLRKRSSV